MDSDSSSLTEKKNSSGGDNDKPQSIPNGDKHDVPSNEEPVKTVQTPPDGGLRAWIRVIGSFLILANTMGLQSSFGAFQAFYAENILQGYSTSTIAWIGTFQIFCTASGGIISGPLFDLGYDKIVVLIGCFFAVIAYMMTSLCTSYWQIFLAQGICGGLSGTFVFSPLLALTATGFVKRRSLAVGATTSGFVFGAVIYPIVFRRLQPTIGFPWTCRVMAFIALGCFLIAYPLVYWNTPRTRGQVRKILDFGAWKEAPYAIYSFAVFFMYAGYWPPYFYIAIFASRAIGTSLNLAFYILAISNAANVVARFTATLIADKLGVVEVLTTSTAISSIVAFCWPAVQSNAGIIVWALAFGYFSGIMSSLFAAVVPNLSPSVSVVGTRLGMLNFLFGIGCLISPPIAGALISVEDNDYHQVGGYLGMQMWVGSCLAVSTALFVYPLIHLRRVRRSNEKSAA